MKKVLRLEGLELLASDYVKEVYVTMSGEMWVQMTEKIEGGGEKISMAKAIELGDIEISHHIDPECPSCVVPIDTVMEPSDFTPGEKVYVQGEKSPAIYIGYFDGSYAVYDPDGPEDGLSWAEIRKEPWGPGQCQDES